MKRIQWTRDELILVLDLYLSNSKTFSKIPEDILAQYSMLLRKMRGTNDDGNPKFRSSKSISMRLENYASLDEYWLRRGRKGLQSGSTDDFRKIWAEFYEHPEEVAALAREIKESVKSSQKVEEISESEPVLEGRRVLRIHYSRERKPHRQKKITSFIKAHGHLFCECCGTTASKYDETIRQKVFEVHHDVPLALASEQVVTNIEDLSLLCAICHRAIYGYEVVPPVDEMKKMLRGC